MSGIPSTAYRHLSLVALVALVGLAAAPAAAAADAGADAPTPETTQIPPCAGIDQEHDAGPATVGVDSYCQVYVDTDTPTAQAPPCHPNDHDYDVGPVYVYQGPYCVFHVEVDDPSAASTIPPCAGIAFEEDAEVATVGIDDFCRPVVEPDADSGTDDASHLVQLP